MFRIPLLHVQNSVTPCSEFRYSTFRIPFAVDFERPNQNFHTDEPSVPIFQKTQVKNPFSVDFEKLEEMPILQSVFATGALMNQLKDLVSSGDHRAYEAYILSDLERLASVHFLCFSTLADAGKM